MAIKDWSKAVWVRTVNTRASLYILFQWWVKAVSAIPISQAGECHQTQSNSAACQVHAHRLTSFYLSTVSPSHGWDYTDHVTVFSDKDILFLACSASKYSTCSFTLPVSRIWTLSLGKTWKSFKNRTAYKPTPKMTCANVLAGNFFSLPCLP